MENLVKNLVQSLVLLLILCDLIAAVPQWHTANDGTRYLIEGELKYNWLEANDECARRGLQIVEIANAVENNALLTLLRSLYGPPGGFWLGFHDQFSSQLTTKRPFFSISTGKELSYTNWKAGEPNNMRGEEHCVLLWSPTDFKWNDEYCEDSKFGFICEDHHITDKYRKDLNGKRLTASQKNTQLASKFLNTRSEINEINANAQSKADRVLIDLEKSTEEIIADLKAALKDIIKKKPYLQAVVADVAQSFNEVVTEKEQEFAKVSNEARQSMGIIHEDVNRSTNKANSKFAEDLTQNTNEIDMLFVY